MPPPGTKGGENMEPNRIEWQKRCTFNGFCKAVLRNEAIDAIRERKYRKKHEVTFSDLSPQEENQLYTCDKYFANWGANFFKKFLKKQNAPVRKARTGA